MNQVHRYRISCSLGFGGDARYNSRAIRPPPARLPNKTQRSTGNVTAEVLGPRCDPSLNFSGVIYANYQYHGEAATRRQNSSYSTCISQLHDAAGNRQASESPRMSFSRPARR